MEQTTPATGEIIMTKKDVSFSALAGLLIGLLLMPVLKAAKPALYELLSFWLVPFFLIATPFGLYIAYLISKIIPIIWQFAKFAVTGVMNALVDLGILALLTFIFRSYLGINSTDILLISITFYSLYKSISFIIANINSYYWNKYWTFHKEGEQSAEFIKFFVVSLVGFLINVLVASIVFRFFSATTVLSSDQWGLIGAAAGSIAGLTWNFVGYKLIVFKK